MLDHEERRSPERHEQFRGRMMPAILVVWAAVNIVTVQAAWPMIHGRALRFVWVEDWFHVLMAAAVKLGIALACFGWYFMPNRDDLSYWAPLTTFVGCASAVAAFVLGSLAFLWQ